MEASYCSYVVHYSIAQALEASCWIPLLLGKRCILAGDHMQLPPTVRSNEALKKGLGVSLFERLMRHFEDSAAEQLICQFRMHRHIMAWSNASFYRDNLVAAACVEGRLLCDTYPETPADAVPPILWIDTAGIPWLREDEEEANGQPTASPLKRSRSNRAEAALVLKYLQQLIETYGVRPADIGVITPYSAQAKLIRRLILDSEQDIESRNGVLGDVTVQTVDGFQGREREVIIISLVRSNHYRDIGFLADARRLNVAVTRARSHLVIIGDSETVTEGGTAKCEASGVDDADAPQAPAPQETQAAATTAQQGQPAPDARKALTALFEMASSCGDLRVPYEYITSSDVPSIDDHRSSGRPVTMDRPGLDRGTKKPQAISCGCGSPKVNRALARNRRAEVPSMTATTAASKVPEPPGLHTPAEDLFVTETRQTLEAFCRRADAEKASRAGSVKCATGTSLTHAFPPSLTSYQRLVVHQLAEELQLEHVSRGEGAERFIEVRTRFRPSQEHLPAEPSTAGEAPQDAQAATSSRQHINTSERRTRPQAQEVPRDLATSSPASEQSTAGEQMLPKPKPSAASKQRKGNASKKKAGAAAAAGDESEDIDALLEEHMAENKKCNVAGCKDSTELLGRTCPYCRSRFCLRHALPEIHGCGDLAAADAKKVFRNQARGNIRLMTYAQDGILGTRAATIAGTVFVNPSVGSNTHMREKLKTNLRKNIEGKAKERASQKATKKKG